MHAALMIDEDRLKAERAWFSRTVVGLVSAGVQVTRVLPASDPGDRRVALTNAIHVPRFHLPWTRKSNRHHVAKQLRAPAVHLIHAIGRSVWADAIEIGQIMEVPVVLEVWCEDEISPAVRAAHSSTVAGLFAASDGIARALQAHVDPSLICEIPIGVYIPDDTKDILASPDRGVAAIIAGRGAALNDVLQLIDGFARIHDACPQLMLFADLESRISRKVWEHLKRHDLLESFSLIPSLNENRRLVMKADLLVVPTATGYCGSFMLEAMASPMAPIVVDDPFVCRPEDGVGCRTIKPGHAATMSERWYEALGEIVLNPERGRNLAEGARAWVAEAHRMSQQVARLHEAYEMILSGGSVPLSQSA